MGFLLLVVEWMRWRGFFRDDYEIECGFCSLCG